MSQASTIEPISPVQEEDEYNSEECEFQPHHHNSRDTLDSLRYSTATPRGSWTGHPLLNHSLLRGSSRSSFGSWYFQGSVDSGSVSRLAAALFVVGIELICMHCCD